MIIADCCLTVWAGVSKMKLTTEFLKWGHQVRIQLSAKINDFCLLSLPGRQG